MVSVTEAPAPDLLIEDQNGAICALMWHFALEHHDIREIATEHGFEAKFREIDEVEEPGLYARYFTGGENVLKDWHPATPDGWQLAGKWDSEDGPVVWFIRKVPA